MLCVRNSFRLLRRCMHTATSSVDTQEIEKFSALANQWWDPRGPFAALHEMNGVRVPLVKEVARADLQHYGQVDDLRSLSGLKILDVGCGGGILSEPLARLGAEVTGVDASATNIGVAEQHASLDSSLHSLQYRCCTVEDMVREQDESQTDGRFDIVIASEVIEHVADPPGFVRSCKNLTRPGGALVFTTINRTMLSYATAIAGAEYVLGLVPPGTHDWRKFVTPDELRSMLQSDSTVSVSMVNGLFYHFLTKHWTRVNCTEVNYALVGIRRTDIKIENSDTIQTANDP